MSEVLAWMNIWATPTFFVLGLFLLAVDVYAFMRSKSPRSETDAEMPPDELRASASAGGSSAKARLALRELVLARVSSGIWHTTSLDRFRGILESGGILPEPDLLDSERWSTSAGPELFPYVRTLGGVSLFDFREFELASYGRKFPACTWAAFVPYCEGWKESVWVEIDVGFLGRNFVGGRDLLDRWNTAKVGNQIMPEIEAAHIGPIPTAAFISAFIARRGASQLEPVDLSAESQV